MPHAVVLGGTGGVGTAAALALVADGWDVTCTGRSGRAPASLTGAGVRLVRSDRWSAADLAAVLGGGADLVVDAVGYTARDARLLLAHRGGIGAVVFVSSKAVYVDGAGRHSNSDTPPDFGGPVDEFTATLPPSDAGGFRERGSYGACKVAAERLLLDADLPVSVLRPSRVHGVGCARPREWVFVARVLAGRRRVLLARGGRGVNHPTAAANLGALVAFCAAHPATRVLNSADPDAPDAATIARAVAAHLGAELEVVGLPDDAPAGLGAHPWDTLPPFVLDTSAAARAGYVPVGTYARTVAAELDWLLDAARGGDPDVCCPPRTTTTSRRCSTTRRPTRGRPAGSPPAGPRPSPGV